MQIRERKKKDIEFECMIRRQHQEEEINMRFFSSLSRLFLLFLTIAIQIVVNKVIRGRLESALVVERYVVDCCLVFV